jgi:hypothetical protein
MRSLPFASLSVVAFASIVLGACSSSSGSAPNGSVPENGDCNTTAECATVAGKQLTCTCAPTGTDTHAQCVASLTAGASCESSSSFQAPCATGLYCAIGAVSGSGTPVATCIAYATSGQDCSGVLCADGLACGDNHTCGPQKAIGGSCTQDRDCAGDALCSALTCAAPPALGQSCFGFTPPPGDTTGTKNPCASGANCVNGTCATAKANGATCASSQECTSELCVMTSAGNGTCQSEMMGAGTEQLCVR